MVEDSPLIRKDAVYEAMREGFAVFEAANADEAIAILEANPSIRLVFTDVEMPGTMDGLKLAEYVAGRWPPVKIIVASGKVPRDMAKLPAGSVFFPKPYDHREVLATMRTLLAA